MRNIEPILGLIIVFSCACGILYEVIWAPPASPVFRESCVCREHDIECVGWWAGDRQLLLRTFGGRKKVSVALVCFSRSRDRNLYTHLPDPVRYSQCHLYPYLSRIGYRFLSPFVDPVCPVVHCSVDPIDADRWGIYPSR